MLEYDEKGKPEIIQKPRICILTFGQETSLNDYSHAQNVFLVGLLHRDELDCISQYVATCDGGRHERITNKTATDLVQSEAVHVIYQALSRGACRVTENGQARPMKAWIIHYSKDIRRRLDIVMPGAQWVEDWPVEGEQGKTVKKAKPLSPEALKLREYLEGLLPEQFPIRIKEAKVESGLTALSTKVWRRVKHEAIDGTLFKIDSRLQTFVLVSDHDVALAPSLLG